MAAGLGFKDFSTGEVLTAADVDGYLMQGIWVFTNTTARNAAVTSPQEGNFAFTKDTNSLWYYDGAAWVASGATGDIEGVTAGIGISGGGTSGTVTVTNSMATAIDAKGDLVAGTGADTFAKLTVGANNTVLTADSAEATGLKWATAAAGGGMTLISTTSLSGASTTISSIPGTYKNLQLVIRDLLPATDSTGLNMRLNGDSTANRYVVYPWNSAAVTNLSFDDTQFGGIVQLIDNGVTNNLTIINLYDYANTDTYRYGTCQGVSVYSANTAQIIAGNYNLYYNQTSAITSITLIMGSGNITSGTALLYGVS